MCCASTTPFPLKRPEDLVAAMLGLADLGGCDFYGETEYLATLEAPTREKMLGNPHIFRLRGPLPRREAVAQLVGAHAFCLPSSDESFPCSIAEAAAMRVPLALSDLPSHRGIWRHGINALLHPVGAVDVLAWNLRALICDPALALRLSDEAYRTAAARLPQERMVQRMTEILQDALADPL